jgi:hypothetical protein
MNILHSTLSTWRDRLAPVSRTSTFRNTGQITPEEFVLAGDYLVYKFPTWSWGDASSPAKRVSYLPAGKQFLVTRGVPCHRRLNDNFAGDAGLEDEIVRDYLAVTAVKVPRTGRMAGCAPEGAAILLPIRISRRLVSGMCGRLMNLEIWGSRRMMMRSRIWKMTMMTRRRLFGSRLARMGLPSEYTALPVSA